MNPFPVRSFQIALKQWVHFPNELEESLKEAKARKEFSVGEKIIKIFPEDTQAAFVNRIITETKLSTKEIRKLMKVSNSLRDLTLQDTVCRLFMRECLKVESSLLSKVKNMCLTFFERFQELNEIESVQYLTACLEENRKENSVGDSGFAKVLACEAPALLYFAFPYLHLSQSEKREVVKLAMTFPLSKELDLKFQKKILCSIKIERWLDQFRIQKEGDDNIRGLLGYLVEQLKQNTDFKPMDIEAYPLHLLRFLHYINGIFKYGILCRERAKSLGILQVSSLDRNLRDPNEVEVNCIRNLQGVVEGIYHKAKGAITVATERKNDLLPAKIIEKAIPGLSFYTYTTLEDEVALKELSERTHHCLLMVGDTRTLRFKDNQGRAVSPEAEIVKGFQANCQRIGPQEGCVEIKVNNNLDPISFRAILISDRFVSCKKFLMILPKVELIFVETLKLEQLSQITTYFGYRETRADEARVCAVKIPIPDFKSSLEKLAETIINKEKACVITHVTKGKCQYDLD